YFVRGYSWPTKSLDGFLPVPHFMITLSENGWDTLTAKVPRTVSERGIEILSEGVAFMRRRVKELKNEGYKRVILAGHSWGAWGALLAAQASDFGADALLLSAPNTFGPRISPISGGPNPTFGLSVSEFPAALKQVKTPTVMIVPDDLVWDPDPARRGAMA